ncbi:MAG: hypothetical protein B7Y25_07855 [Alphaproteobacteria bacterium 16-39-46]|nr:MAG: hypothetical protein B7Y25_07855 [Alphaproteobacteria bacterium 16-39-46]OZA41434.1 MAG: hypothetical protein B7X84_08005 [Alphaproteobacteria bacterium 17-39-52]HQS83965.1 hypothetical protein [Alphaproteobacteria bacterium]HQS93811.1 hypothetical protein [Alphaproteobacteria bacterium]
MKDNTSVDVYAKGSQRIATYADGAWAKFDVVNGNYDFFDPKTKIYRTNIPAETLKRMKAMSHDQSGAIVDLKWEKYHPKYLDFAIASGFTYYFTEDEKFGIKGALIPQAHEIFDEFGYWDNHKDWDKHKERFETKFNPAPGKSIQGTNFPAVTFKNLSDADMDDIRKGDVEMGQFAEGITSFWPSATPSHP